MMAEYHKMLGPKWINGANENIPSISSNEYWHDIWYLMIKMEYDIFFYASAIQ